MPAVAASSAAPFVEVANEAAHSYRVPMAGANRDS
jgi:hypothetical protein